ncbi:MAG: hypothetical protein F2930_04600, partial [Actinobacteria bacterium]|nr:hypothetical protein [Actinomycetota bacterium]
TGVVTFNPLSTFTGQVQTPVTYQVKDSLDRYVSSTLTPTVGPPPVPTATADALTSGYDTNQTYTPTSNDTAGAPDFPISATSVKLCGLADSSATPPVAAETPNTCSKTSLTVPGEGTYTVNGDGSVTFDPLPSFTGQAQTPVKYQAKDSLDRYVNSTITPTVGPPPVPTATPDAITDAYDANQAYSPTSNDTAGAPDFPISATSVKLCGLANSSATPPVAAQTPNSCDKTSLTVPGEGTYTVNANGTITFDPLPTFTGQVQTPVTYQAKDSLNRFVNTTITPTVGPPPVPTATPDAITDAYDTNQTYTPLGNDTAGAPDFPLLTTSVKLCGLANSSATPPVAAETPNTCSKTSLTVPGEGTYTVNANGTVTFDPLPSFTGTAQTPVRYQANDSLDRYVNTTITPTVNNPPGPVAVPNTSSGDYNVNQTIDPLANDSPSSADFPFVATSVKLCGLADNTVTPAVPAETPNGCSKTTVTVPGEGTYTLDATTGVVTFDPLPSFTGQVQTPVKYQVKDSLDRYVNSTITPTVGPPPVPTASPDAITDTYDKNQVYTPTANDTKGAADFPIVATTVKLCGADNPATQSVDESVPPNCNAASLTVAGEGTYTVDPVTGDVAFNPLPSFTGLATPVKYQVADTLGRVANSTITPTVGPPPVPTASPDAITDAYDKNQVYTPVTNDTKGAADFPFVATTVKLCGADNPATQSVDESVPPNCNATSLTVTGEGTYTVNPDGTVTFDPLPTFTGTVVTVVKYQATDTLGRITNSTITPTVTPPTAPTAAPETKSVLPGGTVAFTTITGGSGLATGTGLATTGATATCLINPATTACGTGFTNSDGTWSINQATGVVTFVAANPLAEGIKTPVTYRVTDVTGQTATSTLTPIVPPPPVANNDTSTGAYDTNQTINPLTNDKSGDASAPLVPASVKLCGADNPATPTVDESVAPNCNATTLVVPGEGTYTVNPTTGVVTFDPLPTFTGTATPVPYQVTDSVGRTVTATITPSVTPPPVPTATPNTGRNAYDTNQVVNPVTNDTPGAPTATFVPTSVKLCGADDPATLTVDESVVPNCNATTLVVPGEGTYTVNPTTGVVTFDPLPSFKGTATPVTYQVTDILNRTASSTITLTVDPPPAPTATPETKIVLPGSSVAFTNTTGTAGLATGTGLVTTGPTATCLFTPATTTCDSDNSVEITGVGTYVLNPATGVVTFTALSSAMSGNQPSITYRVTDITGQTATSTLTPIIPAPPAATNDVSSGPYDTNQAISPLTNDSFSSLALASKATLRLCGIDDPATSGVNETETPDNCSKTSLIVPGQGSFTVNTTTGVVTFDPEPTFVGTATPVGYQVADVLGRYVDATITPTVAPPGAPIATPETKLVLPGATITFTPITGTSGLATGTGLATTGSTATCLFTPGTTTCDADNSITIVGEGTWTLDPATGVVTFTASATIMPGTKTPVTYRVTDVAGQTATSILTPIVPSPPAATNDTSSGPYDTNQTISPLANDSFSSLSPAVISTIKLCGVDPAQKPNDCDKTVVVVPNEGTYTLNANGTVTFDPLPTFVGTATPLGYQVQDTVGRYVNATISPTVAAPPIPAATQDTGTAKQGKTIVLTPWLNDTAGTVPSDPATKVSLVPTSIRLCPLSTVVSTDVISTAQSNPACTLTKLTTVDGTYTVDTKTGKVTFVHKKGFVGTVTQPVTYQIANNWDGVTTPQVTTSQLIPTIIGEVAAAQRIANSVSIGDKVWRDLNGNGKQGAADFGIAGVKVTLFTAKGKPVVDLLGKTVTSLRTDKDGKYLFTNLPAGQYKVVVTYPPKFRSTIPNRGPRDKDSSTYQAKSKVLALGQSDLSLGFGMVPLMTSGLAHTL